MSLGKHSNTFHFAFVYVDMRVVFFLLVVCAIIMCICKKNTGLRSMGIQLFMVNKNE